MLRALCYCDSNSPAMDQIFYFSHRATVSIMKSGNKLNNDTLLGTLGSDNELKAKVDEVFGGGKDRRCACIKLLWYCLLLSNVLTCSPLMMHCFDPISIFKTTLNVPLWM